MKILRRKNNDQAEKALMMNVEPTPAYTWLRGHTRRSNL